jgi:dipeptidyl aminopeptidase/acylaminoacyl peptidase
VQVSRLGGLFPLLAALASAQERYRIPPEPILSLVLAEDAPSTALCPDKVHLLMVRREAMPSIETAARPHLKLAGARIDPLTYGPQLGTRVTKLSLRTLEDPTERVIVIPGAGHLGGVSFNADGSRFALTNTVASGIELWVGETATAKARRVDGVLLNAVQGATLRWLPDQQSLLCSLRLPAAAPVAPAAPRGPNVSQSLGKKATVRTYQDLLQDEHDVELFVHYGTVQLATVDAASGSVRKLGEPVLCSGVSASPDGKFLLVERTHAPFSFHVPAGQFPQETMVWTSDGTKVVTLVDQPLADTVPIGGVVTGRRSIQWVPASEHTLMWAEALDEGNPKKQVDKRDRVFLLTEPKGTPQVWFETQHRFGGAQFGEDGALVLVSEMDRQQRRARTWRYDCKDLAAAPKLLMDRSTQDAYGDPGRPMTRTDKRGRGLVRQDGTALYLSGQGASKDGDRPFLDRWDLASGEKQRLFQCAEGRFETVQGFVDEQGARILISSESKDTPPNTWLVNLQDGARKQVTTYDDPAREKLAGVKRELIKYTRKDGVPLSGQLYLPPGHQPGQKLAAFVWAYPREYNQASDAGQVRGSPHRYVRMDGISHLFMLFKGYAVLDEAAMPIVGPVETANDQFLPQLVMNGEAAVEALAARGIDRTRIAVGGHSYGAFMTANLLAHSDLFRCGIARSGAYNRTLTPFGFQNEERTLWQAPAIYAQMSPFMHADKVNEPILLIHGEDDNNPGTFPVQSQRFYSALQGHGATARLVMLPHESHGYRAKESVLHTLAEMGDWLDRWLRAD